MAKVETWCWTRERPVGHIRSTQLLDGREQHSGTVDTTNGAVNVLAREASDTAEGWVSFTFIRDGLIYQRTIDQCYRPRYLVTLAQRFSDEVVNDTWEEEGDV